MMLTSGAGVAVRRSSDSGGQVDGGAFYVGNPDATGTVTDTVDGQNVKLLVPAVGDRNGAVVLFHHGASETETTIQTADPIMNGLYLAGYIVAGSNAHGNAFGSIAACQDYVNLWQYVTNTWGTTKCVHWGKSMGGLTALVLIANNDVPDDGFLGTYPLIDRVNGGFTLDDLGASYDPMQRAASDFANVPMRFYASPGDLVVPKVDNTDPFVVKIAADPAEHAVVVCSGDHGDASHFQTTDYLDFFARCIA